MKEDLLNRIRIASPCNVSWESMTGSERARFCSQCDLHVYDISRLTHKEALALITKTQGRICGRIHRRADGTVLTRDCPVGLRAIRRRVARMAGAALATVLGMASIVVAQKVTWDQKPLSPAALRVERKETHEELGSVKGKLLDMAGWAITDAIVKMSEDGSDVKRETVSDSNGEFSFVDVTPGTYALKIEMAGSPPFSYVNLKLDHQEVELTATLDFVIIQMGVLDQKFDNMPSLEQIRRLPRKKHK